MKSARFVALLVILFPVAAAAGVMADADGTESLLTFSGAPPTIPNTVVFCTPNGGACSPFRTTAEVPIPPMRAKSMKCWATSPPGYSGSGLQPNSWVMRMEGVYGALSCTIAGSETQCTTSGNAVFPEGGHMCMAIMRGGSPTMGATVTCSVRAVQ